MVLDELVSHDHSLAKKTVAFLPGKTFSPCGAARATFQLLTQEAFTQAEFASDLGEVLVPVSDPADRHGLELAGGVTSLFGRLRISSR